MEAAIIAIDGYAEREWQPPETVSGCVTPSVEACVVSAAAGGAAAWHFGEGMDFNASAAAAASSPALRSRFFLADDGSSEWEEFKTRLVRTLDTLSDETVTVSWIPIDMMGEVLLVLFDDAYKVVASLAFLLLFTCAVLAMPIFAAASLAIVVLSFPVAYAFYVGR